MLSFILAGIACVFAGLCYAEFASLIPIAGSAYTYGYATLGEIFAWIIGWDLILEYAFGAATVASGWSGYCVSFLQDFGIRPSAADLTLLRHARSCVLLRRTLGALATAMKALAGHATHRSRTRFRTRRRLQSGGLPGHHRGHHHPGDRH